MKAQGSMVRRRKGALREGTLPRALGAVCLILAAAAAAAAERSLESLKSLSLDELADMQVSILSNRPERMADSAAAVFVLTSEDIRRTGYTSIAEILRLVPGLNVARVDTAEWAITSRGFNSRYANKLLVMMDGRSVYVPLFSGVLWESIDTPLEDIERIEVIRGPGASTWGANAVNGVINIITKHAADTQGGLVSGFAGNLQRGATGRYGAPLGESGWLRAYAKYNDRDGEFDLDGKQDDDIEHGGRAGFRSDLDLAGGSALAVQGELFDEDPTDPSLSGGHLLLRWDRPTADGALDSFQFYYDRLNSSAEDYDLEERLDTLDVELRRQFAPRGQHGFSVGLGYRWQRSAIEQRPTVSADPPERQLKRFSAFLQDDIALLEDLWYLTLGTKLEHNNFTGWELQPTVRTRWNPNRETTLWAAVSRAVRTPTRAEHDLAIQYDAGVPFPGPASFPVISYAQPNPDMDSETLMAYELGLRWRPTPVVGFDLALFYNDYGGLRTTEIGAPVINFSPPQIRLPNQPVNNMDGETYGMELVADWRPGGAWRLQASYALLDMQLRKNPGSTDRVSEEQEGQSPRNQVGLRFSADLAHNLELDLFGRYVDRLPAFNVDAYAELDARLGWRVRPGLSLALVGRNLLDSLHQEYGAEPQGGGKPHLIGRELFLRGELRF